MKKNLEQELSTNQEKTWCPGCTNNGILAATKKALANLIRAGEIRQNNIAIVADIGCGAKIYDYLNVNAFCSLHGRILPTALGINVANPGLTVLAFGGDGGTYNEGISHFIHSCRYNDDVTLLVNNNQVFALTTGQATSTTERGFKGPSMPFGNAGSPLNPLVLALESGATFVARAYALDVDHLANIIKKAVNHRGFSFIDILQPCLTFHNVIPYFQKYIYKLETANYSAKDFSAALKKAREWDYSFTKKSKVAVGVFYNVEKPTYAEKWLQKEKPWYKIERNNDFRKFIREFK